MLYTYRNQYQYDIKVIKVIILEKKFKTMTNLHLSRICHIQDNSSSIHNFVFYEGILNRHEDTHKGLTKTVVKYIQEIQEIFT